MLHGHVQGRGWDEQLKFDCIIDGTLIGVVKK